MNVHIIKTFQRAWRISKMKEIDHITKAPTLFPIGLFWNRADVELLF